MNVDSKKQNPLIAALNVPPPPAGAQKASSAEKKTIDLDAAPANATSGAASFFAKSTSAGGVSSSVFGGKTPAPEKMSEKELRDGIAKLADGIRGHAGKATEADLRLLGAMSFTLARKFGGDIDLSKAPKDLDNKSLVATLMALDLRKASGAPLTKEQAAFASKAEAEWKGRLKNDKAKDLAELEAKRAKVAAAGALSCAAAGTGIVGLAMHSPVISGVSAGLATSRAVMTGEYREALVELGLYALSFSPAKTIAEGASIAKSTWECAATAHELDQIDGEIASLKAGK